MVWIPALPCPNFVILGNLSNLSAPQFPSLYNGWNHGSYLGLGRWNKNRPVKCSGHGLALGKPLVSSCFPGSAHSVLWKSGLSVHYLAPAPQPTSHLGGSTLCARTTSYSPLNFHPRHLNWFLPLEYTHQLLFKVNNVSQAQVWDYSRGRSTRNGIKSNLFFIRRTSCHYYDYKALHSHKCHMNAI